MWPALLTAKKTLQWFLELLVSASVALLVLDVLWGVCSRFILGSPSRWTEEVAVLLLMWVALLGAAVALSRKEHLGVDVLVKQLDPEVARMLAIVVQVLTIAFASIVLIYGGYLLVSQSLASSQVTPALGINMGFVYLAVPLSGLFMVLFSIERIAELVFRQTDSSPTAVESVAQETQ